MYFGIGEWSEHKGYKLQKKYVARANFHLEVQ